MADGETTRPKFWYIRTHRETCANVVVVLLLAVCALLAWHEDPTVAYSRKAPRKLTCSHPTPVKVPAKVSDPSGAGATLSIFIGGSGLRQLRDSSPLAIQTGKLTALAHLCTSASDFVRSDGQILPEGQVTSDAIVSDDGRDLTVRVAVAPRYVLVSGFGEYSGKVSLDDSRALGASVPVRIYVEYPYANLALLCGLLAAAAGMFWALLVRKADLNSKVKDMGQLEKDKEEDGLFWASLALRVAVLATAIPVVNAQVLSNPSWTGTLSEYIKLGTAAGAVAIAATPTLSVIVGRIKRPELRNRRTSGRPAASWRARLAARNPRPASGTARPGPG